METQFIKLNMTPTGINPCFHVSQYDIGRSLGFIVYNGSEVVDLDGYTCTIEATRSDGVAITTSVASEDNVGTFETTATMTNKADKYRCQLVIVDANSKRIASLPFDMEVTKAAMDENSGVIEEDASLYQQYTKAVQGAIAEANANIQAEENARIAAVSAEAAARAHADTTLQNNIDAEAAARANAITAETAARVSAVDAEATARQAADNTLQSNINAEASTRATQDASLQSQIDQLVAPTGEAPSAAEVQNARIGVDGTVYPTLGDAIRDQVADLKSQITNTTDYIREGTTRIFPKWEVGAINNSGIDEASTTMVRCSPILLLAGDKFKSSNTSLRVFYYKLDGTFIGTLYSVTANSDYVTDKPVLVRFRVAYNSSLAVNWYDQNLTITKYNPDEVQSEDIKVLKDAKTEICAFVFKPLFTFGIGGLNTTTGEEIQNDARARSTLFYVPKTMYIRSTNDSYVFRVLKYDVFGNFVQTINNSNVSSQSVSEGYYRVLIFPSDTGVTDLTNYLTDIDLSIWCREQKHLYVVSKDGTGDFDDVQTALDFAIHASASYPVTIFIEPGTYDPISTITQKKYVPSIPNTGTKYYNRYISLIGRNEKTCIIKGNSGEYYYPAAEINVTGLIANLTFISTHDSPPSNMTDDANYTRHKAYAVHSDYGTEDSIYQNCTMISYQAPGIGIGGARNKKIRIRNCHIYSYAPASGDYSPLVNYGGLFYHLQPADGITGQLLEVEDSYIFSKNGNKSLWISVSSATNYEQETHLIRNCCYGDSCGKVVSVDAVMLSDDSYGNSASAMNK